MDEFQKYQELKGSTAKAVCVEGKKDGLNNIDLIRMLRAVFCLSISEAKSVLIESESGQSLTDYQARLLPSLQNALEQFDSGDPQDE